MKYLRKLSEATTNKICEIFKSTYFGEYLETAASKHWLCLIIYWPFILDHIFNISWLNWRYYRFHDNRDPFILLINIKKYWFKLTAFKSSKTSSRFTKKHSSTVSLIHIVAEIRLVHNLAKKVVKCVLHYIRAEYFNRWFLGLGMSTFWNLWRFISPKPKKIVA